jgi:xanthine dehydrogenase YagR molybdenum-binding subunit
VHSAIFAEVKVDEQLGVVRVTRVVNAVAAGRILNAKTARSQIMGGVVWASAWPCTRRPWSTTPSDAL